MVIGGNAENFYGEKHEKGREKRQKIDTKWVESEREEKQGEGFNINRTQGKGAGVEQKALEKEGVIFESFCLIETVIDDKTKSNMCARKMAFEIIGKFRFFEISRSDIWIIHVIIPLLKHTCGPGRQVP